MLQKPVCKLADEGLVVITQYKVGHDLAGGADPQLKVPEPALVLPDIVEAEVFLQPKVADGLAKAVGGFGLEVAGIDIDHFIKKAFGMKAGHPLFRADSRIPELIGQKK